VYFETFSAVFTLFSSLFTRGFYGEGGGCVVWKCNQRKFTTPVINQSSKFKVHMLPSSLDIRQSVVSLNVGHVQFLHISIVRVLFVP
jgi:hypothetical protein